MGKKAGSGQRKVRSTAILGKSMAGLVKRSYAGKKALVENGFGFECICQAYKELEL
jgi:hypothetical protein